MALNCVDNRGPIISVKLMPRAFQRQQLRLRKSLGQRHAVSVRQDRVFGAVDDKRRDAYFIEPAKPAVPT